MSACAPTDHIIQQLTIAVPGATEDLMKLQLWNVLDEFFRRTNAWQFREDIKIDGSDNEYPLAVPGSSRIVRIMSVSQNNVPVPATASTSVVQNAFGELDASALLPDGDATYNFTESDIDGSDIFSWSMFRPDYISFTGNLADQAKFPITVVAALSISRGCLECDCGDWDVPEWMWDMFFQDWLDGTLWRLHGMPAKPWSNERLAVYHGRRFRNHMAFRKQEAMRGFSYNKPTWRFPGSWTR